MYLKSDHVYVYTIGYMQQYTNKQRRSILEKINSLSSTEHEEILKIVKRHGISFSQNKNGIFFNLSNLDYQILYEIDMFVTYCISNKKELDEYDKIINECKLSNRIDGVMPAISTSLGEMSRLSGRESEKEGAIESRASWNKYKVDAATIEKFVRFAEKVASDKEKGCKKKMNVKFNNAKKRFAKKSERKIDPDMKDVLMEEPYIII